jgi:hypothetical protein
MQKRNSAGRHGGSSARRIGRLTAFLLAGTCLSPVSVWAANINVNSDASLRSAITSAGSGDTITFTSNITLAADLPAAQTDVTIIGNNQTLSGNNQFRGLFIGAFSGSSQVAVAVQVDLIIGPSLTSTCPWTPCRAASSGEQEQIVRRAAGAG